MAHEELLVDVRVFMSLFFSSFTLRVFKNTVNSTAQGLTKITHQCIPWIQNRYVLALAILKLRRIRHDSQCMANAFLY